MLHNLFTIVVNGKHHGGGILLLPTVWYTVNFASVVGYMPCGEAKITYKSNAHYSVHTDIQGH